MVFDIFFVIRSSFTLISFVLLYLFSKLRENSWRIDSVLDIILLPCLINVIDFAQPFLFSNDKKYFEFLSLCSCQATLDRTISPSIIGRLNF